TSCSVRSTFDDSSAPDWISPKLLVPAEPRTASPEVNVSPHDVSPSWRKPCGFAKFESATWPSGCERPFVKRAKTTPCESTSMLESRPDAKPFWFSELTPKLEPYCVDRTKL